MLARRPVREDYRKHPNGGTVCDLHGHLGENLPATLDKNPDYRRDESVATSSSIT